MSKFVTKATRCVAFAVEWVRTVFLAAALTSLLGCAAHGEYTPTDSTHAYQPKPDSYDMPVLSGKPGRAFKEIGTVTAAKQATTTLGEVKEADLMPELKKQGRRMGADALIDLRFENFTKSAVFSSRGKNALRAQATAVVYIEQAADSL